MDACLFPLSEKHSLLTLSLSNTTPTPIESLSLIAKDFISLIVALVLESTCLRRNGNVLRANRVL